MLVVIGFAALCAAILLLAVRILLGWFAPAGAVGAFDRGVNATLSGFFKACVLIAAGLIVYLIGFAK